MAATATATSKTTTYNDIPKGRGVRIFEQNKKKIAVVPRNSARFLEGLLAQGPYNQEEWVGQKNVYVIEKDLAKKIFSENPDTAPSLANSSRSLLEDKKILETVRSGSPSTRAVVKMLVDDFVQSETNQGVRPATKGPRKARIKKTADGRTTSSRRVTTVGRPSVASKVQAKDKFLDGLGIESVAEFRQGIEMLEYIEATYPNIYKKMI